MRPAPSQVKGSSACQLLLVLLAIGCGSDNSATGPAATGSLAVTVTNSSAATAAVHVTGPAGYSHDVTTTTTLSGLTVGRYAVSGDSVATIDSVVGTAVYAALVIDGAPTVSKGDTARSSVTYSLARQRGALWVADILDASAMESYGADQLRSARRLTAVGIATSSEPDGVAFDSSGNMWVSGIGEAAVRKYTIAARSATGALTSDAKLTVTNLYTPEQMAFDASGTLWIADYYGGLVGLSAAQLASGDTLITGAISIQDTTLVPYQTQEMQGIALDAAGNVWLTELGTNQIVEFTHDQLASSGAKSPAVRIGGSINDPVALAFDTHGNLWVANEDGSSLYMYAPAQLAASGASAPTVALVVTKPGGLAFDRSGALWVTNKFDALISEFGPSQLTSSSSPVPEKSFTHDLHGFDHAALGAIAFDPWAAVSPEPVP